MITRKENVTYLFVEGLYTDVKSFDGKLYVCRTCDIKLKKGKALCLAVCNKLAVSFLLAQFKSVRKIESSNLEKAIVQESDNHAKGSVAKIVKEHYAIFQLSRLMVVPYYQKQ